MSQASTPNIPIPSRVGHYQLLKTIGKGQFGYVKLATHDLTGERVAIKVIQKNRLDEKTLKMVSREISIMKLLNHPNVIRLYEVIDSDIFLFLVMEYAAGGEIMDFIVTHGKLKERDARRIFRQVVEAIDYCHEVHVIHRDLKAENLLLDSQFGIKLIDFGLSNRWAPGELLKTFCGSPTYTAPELIKRQQYEGPEVDLWSLGVLLYVLVCGSLPFDGNTFQELFTKIINGQYTVPDHVSAECRDLIGRMLVVNPKQRATLDQVREHPWIRESGKPVPKASLGKIHVPVNEDDVDQEILDELVAIGFERDYAIQAILSNSYEDAAATYYLLVESKRRRTPHHINNTSENSTPRKDVAASNQTQNHPNYPSNQQFVNAPPAGVSQIQYQQMQQHNQAHQVISAGNGAAANSRRNVPPNIQQQNQNGNKLNNNNNNNNNNYINGGLNIPGTHATTMLNRDDREMNPAFKGQAPRRERADVQRHRRHHTVGTPGEFPIDEEPSSIQTSILVPSESAHRNPPHHIPINNVNHYYNNNSPQYASPTLHGYTNSPSPNSSSQNIFASPSHGKHSKSSSKSKIIVEEDEEASTELDVSLANLSVTSSANSSHHSKPSKRKSGERSTRKPSPSSTTDEVYEVYYSGSPSGTSQTSAQSSRASRPTGGLPPRSATMRTEKHRHKDHSRPVSAVKVKRGHHRSSIETEDDMIESVSSSPLNGSKEIKKSKSGSNNINGVPSPSRSRKGSKDSKELHKLLSSSPSWTPEEDSHLISLSPSSPPHSPARSPAPHESFIELNKSGGSAPHTPLKPVVIKKESRSLLNNFKRFFSRKSGPEPRQVRFSINENNTSHEPPEAILARIIDVLKSMDLPHQHFISPFCLKTETDTGVVLEVEICQLPIIHLIGVRFRRICGDAWQYTRVCKKILDLLDLNNSSKNSSSSRLSFQSNNSSEGSHQHDNSQEQLGSSVSSNQTSPGIQKKNSKRQSSKSKPGSEDVSPFSSSSSKRASDESKNRVDEISPQKKHRQKPTLPATQWEDETSSSETTAAS